MNFVNKNADTSELSELPYHVFCAMNVYPNETFHSSSTSLLVQPSTRSDFTRYDFCQLAPDVWNSLPRTVLDNPTDSL